MKELISKYTLLLSISSVFFLSLLVDSEAVSDASDVSDLYQQANEHLVLGELRQAIIIYEEILEISPDNTNVLMMKGIALSNLEQYKHAMKDFYDVLEKEPNSVPAILGMGVGFGNFGEYKEAKKYFDRAAILEPGSHVVKNFQDFAEKTIKKYPYNEVEKPKIIEGTSHESIPDWVKNNAAWWSDNQITDKEFLVSIQFLIENKIIKINSVEKQQSVTKIIPDWVKNNAAWWSDNQITDKEFLDAIEFLVKDGVLIVDLPKSVKFSEDQQKIDDRNRWGFHRYLDRIEKTVNDDLRYIEYPNPSGDVIKKFMRNYAKWNFDQQIEIGNTSFPDPGYTIIDEIYHIRYNVFINDQPDGLPLDHVDTLDESFAFWEEKEFTAQDGKMVKVNFKPTMKHEANLWVTWVVRDIGQNVLGHANLGKGVVEVALGGFNCDGSFQLFHVDTVKTIMTHELGHGIGLKHSSDSENIMYPTIKETKYAYCLLDEIK